jgi:hypothetical protein
MAGCSPSKADLSQDPKNQVKSIVNGRLETVLNQDPRRKVPAEISSLQVLEREKLLYMLDKYAHVSVYSFKDNLEDIQFKEKRLFLQY